MNTLIICCLVLVAIYLMGQITILLLVITKELRGRLQKNEPKSRNYIVINGREYRPKRMGRETDCKTECPLYAHCEKGSHSLCMALQHPYEDVIMVEDGREE